MPKNDDGATVRTFIELNDNPIYLILSDRHRGLFRLWRELNAQFLEFSFAIDFLAPPSGGY